jgi:methionyl-tRNA formyltransferase
LFDICYLEFVIYLFHKETISEIRLLTDFGRCIMRIILIGQAPFGAGVLEGLLAKGEEVVAVYSPPDTSGGQLDPLKSVAVENMIAVFQPDTYKTDQVFAEYVGLKPDLTILAFVPRIIPARYLELPTHDAICFHPSNLPRHRGASAINWALIMGDTKTGLSIFWPNAGIDTGPVLLQREVEIVPQDTAGSLYFNHLFPMGVAAILESVELIKAGRAPRITQNEQGATYEPPCDDRVAGIDWRKPAREIYNLIRGCDPQPGAYAYREAEKIRFYGAALLPEPVADKPGTIVQIDSGGVHIAVNGGRLAVTKIRSGKSPKMSAGNFAAENGLRVGDRLVDAPSLMVF